MRTARALALVLIVIVSALLLAELFYATPNLFYRGSVIVRAYAIGSYGLLVWLTNASFSVWAWAPTPNGTEFMPIYNGTGFQAVIGLRKLASWAEDWVHAYGKVAIGVFEPSIIIWVSYYIRLPNGSVELVAQPFYRPLNLSLPLSGILGMVVNAVMGRPFITVVKASGANARGSGDTLAFPPPFYVVPHVIAWYPNDTGMAPISLAVALAQPSSASGGVADVEISTEGFPAIVDSVTLSGSEFEAALRVAESGNLLQAVRTLSPVMGPALDFTSILSIGTVAYILLQNEKGPDISQLYIVGQGALVNWTEVSAFGRPVTWYLSLQPTEARIAKFKPTKFVSYTGLGLYYWWGYDKCVNLSEWAREQQVLMQNSSYFFKAGMNSTCPLPNTPAPVIWEDYATNLTYYATVRPGGNFIELSYELSHGVNGTIISPLGAGIDLGSAIASVMEGKDFGQPGATASADLIAGVLVPFQYLVFNEIMAFNSLPRGYYVNVYFNDLTPVYYNASGYGFTLPGKLVLINVSSSP
ncbi:MAG: hypothetical protein JCHSAcid_05160 [uncultured Acidilobus sp. JCHS]|nr:MAG: hypothetical protein JCHSAcid_05160 [uncultured Acidilobus sp. JCHS]